MKSEIEVYSPLGLEVPIVHPYTLNAANFHGVDALDELFDLRCGIA